MTQESIHPEVEAFEFDPQEVEARPRTIIALKDGPKWLVTNETDDVVGLLENTDYRKADTLIEFHSCQDEAALGSAPLWLRPSEVSCVVHVSEARWKADRFKQHLQEQAMRRQQAGGGIARPPGL